MALLMSLQQVAVNEGVRDGPCIQRGPGTAGAIIKNKKKKERTGEYGAPSCQVCD